MKVSKDKLLIFSFVALIVLGFIISYVQQYSQPSKAVGTGVTITMSAPSASVPVNQDSVVTVTVTTPDAAKKISGFDLVFNGGANLTMTNASAPVATGGGNVTATEFVKSVTAQTTRLSYAYLSADADLPTTVSFQLTVRGTAAGTGTLTLNAASSSVVGNIPSNSYDLPTLQPLTFTFTGNGGGTPTMTPTPTIPLGTPTINVRVAPTTGTQALNTNFTVSLIVDGQQAGQKISGIDIKLKADPVTLRINSVGEPIDTTTGDGSKFTKLTNTFNASTGEIQLNYVSIQQDAALPSSAKLDISLTGIANGTGYLTVQSAQVTGNISQIAYGVVSTPGQYTIGSGGLSPTVTGNPTPTGTITVSPTITTNPSVTVTPTGTTGSMVLNLKLKFQGILKQPPTAANSFKVQVMVGKDGFLSSPQSGTFTSDANGIWSGTVSFNNVPAGSGYRIYVKGPKHLQKKFCDAAPTETSSGTYRCADGKITLNNGQNTFDLSKVYMLVGDLPEQGGAQNGVVDSYDTSYIKLNLGSSGTKELSIADLNLDGIVDTQDYSLVIAALNIKYDEF